MSDDKNVRKRVLAKELKKQSQPFLSRHDAFHQDMSGKKAIDHMPTSTPETLDVVNVILDLTGERTEPTTHW